MRHRLMLCTTSAMLLSACATSRTFTPTDREAVTTVLQQQRDSWNRGDLESYMNGYAREPSLVFTSSAEIRRGWNETLASYRAKYQAGGQTMGTLEFKIIEVRSVGPDAAVVLGRWILTDTPAAGDGVFSVVFERRAEGWRVIHDHTSLTPRLRGG